MTDTYSTASSGPSTLVDTPLSATKSLPIDIVSPCTTAYAAPRAKFCRQPDIAPRLHPIAIKRANSSRPVHNQHISDGNPQTSSRLVVSRPAPPPPPPRARRCHSDLGRTIAPPPPAPVAASDRGRRSSGSTSSYSRPPRDFSPRPSSRQSCSGDSSYSTCSSLDAPAPTPDLVHSPLPTYVYPQTDRLPRSSEEPLASNHLRHYRYRDPAEPQPFDIYAAIHSAKAAQRRQQTLEQVQQRPSRPAESSSAAASRPRLIVDTDNIDCRSTGSSSEIVRQALHREIDAMSTNLQSASASVASSSSPASAGSTLKRKILIMGSRSVGKSSLTKKYISGEFEQSYYPTIEMTHQKTIVRDGITYDCEIIDTAGQDEYSLFHHKYAVGIHGYILVYSIASRQSFEMIQNLHDKILDFQAADKVCCVIVGQKSDLDDGKTPASRRVVKSEEGKALATKLGAGFVETSASKGVNVSEAFDILMDEMRKVYNPAPEKKKKPKSSGGGGGWLSSWFGGSA